jgi:hypothetical protein
MARYDSGVLQEYADSLYFKARWITAKCVGGGALVGAIVVGTFIELVERSSILYASPVPFVILAGLGAIIGFGIGQGKGFKYRLEAQTLLCQMQIECNTRKET